MKTALRRTATMYKTYLLCVMLTFTYAYSSRKSKSFFLDELLDEHNNGEDDAIKDNTVKTDDIFGELTASEHVHNQLNDVTDVDSTPGFISFNVNPYIRIYGGYWDDYDKTVDDYHAANMFYRPPNNNDISDIAYSLKETIDKPSKRLYIHESGPSLISRYKMRRYPYTNVVRLSTGCTGTLLTPKHVMTAAHCVHDGVNFKNNIEMLKIEVPDIIGYRVHYIVKINVPVMWLKTQKLPEVGRGAYDYAVLQLNLPVGGRYKFMQLALPTVKTLNSDFHFLGFFPTKSQGLWHSTCSADENLVIMGGNVVLTECESGEGNSGAAIFNANNVEGDKIIGILSNSITTTSGRLTTKPVKFEAIMLLTLPKCLDICAMIYPEGEKYDVCKTVKKYNLKYLQVSSSRILPFFG